MPSEEMHHGAQGSARTEAPRLVVEEHVQGNIRDTKKFENLGDRSTTYNTPGFNPEDPYNFAHPEAEKAPTSPETQEAVVEALAVDVDALQSKVSEYENRIAQLEAILRDTREIADAQPRRVRHQDGVTEQLVKYKNGKHISYEWEAVEQKPQADEEAEGWAEFERQRDAGAFKDIEPGQKAEDASAAPAVSGEQAEPVDAPKSTESGEAEAENAPNDTPETTEGDQASSEDASVESVEPTEQEPAEDEVVEQGPTAKQFEIPQSAELTQAKGRLEDAVEQYAKLTAKERGGYTGHFLHNSQVLVKIPGLKWLADKYNAWDDKNLNESREAYVAATTALQSEIVKAMHEKYGEEADERAIQEANLVAISADMKLEAQIMKDRMDNDPKANKFMNWWLKHDSLGKKILKYGLPGAAIGAVTALAGAPILLGAGVAAAGAGVMAHIANRHRANSVNAENGAVYAKENHDQDLARKSAYADEQEKTGSIISAANFSDITEERTGREKTKNRTNVASSAAIAFGGAKLAGLGVDMLTPDANADAGAGTGAEDEAARQAAEEEAARRAAEEAAKTPEIVGNEFAVESGSSYTQELMEFAGANGHALTPDQSWQLHQDLMGQFGGDYIDINGAGADTYVDAGDVRLTEPGSAKWADGVGQYIQQWMATRGLW